MEPGRLHRRREAEDQADRDRAAECHADDGGRDVFVHITAVERAGLKALLEGQRISFEVEPDKKGKGPKAVNLVITG